MAITISYREELIFHIPVALQQQKKGLMHRLLTGQVRVKVGEEVGRTSKVRPT